MNLPKFPLNLVLFVSELPKNNYQSDVLIFNLEMSVSTEELEHVIRNEATGYCDRTLQPIRVCGSADCRMSSVG